MRASVLTAAASLFVGLVAGCGQAVPGGAGASGSGSGSKSGSPAATVVPGCRADAPEVQAATPLVRADLDGDGTPETVRRTASGAGPCGDVVLVDVGGRLSGVSLAESGIAPGPDRSSDPASDDAVYAVQPAGRRGALVFVSGAPHPRGGFQPHLLGLGPQGLGEVTAGEGPLLPFVATDGGGQPTTAQCTPGGGIATVTATTHEPPGIVLAWDVHRTTYSLRGVTARRTGTSTVATAVADPTLRRDMPELFRPTFFTDCRAGGPAGGPAGR